MAPTIEVSDELAERLDTHRDEGQSRAELIEELVTIYEQESRFIDEGL